MIEASVKTNPSEDEFLEVWFTCSSITRDVTYSLSIRRAGRHCQCPSIIISSRNVAWSVRPADPTDTNVPLFGKNRKTDATHNGDGLIRVHWYFNNNEFVVHCCPVTSPSATFAGIHLADDRARHVPCPSNRPPSFSTPASLQYKKLKKMSIKHVSFAWERMERRIPSNQRIIYIYIFLSSCLWKGREKDVNERYPLSTWHARTVMKLE